MTMRMRTGMVAAAVAALVSPGLALAAGDVAAVVKKGSLVLTGDADGNEITIDQAGLGAGELRVTPGLGTTLNGAAAPAVFPGVTGGITAKLGDGNNDLVLDGVNLAGDVAIALGDQGDTVMLGGTFGGDATLTFGDGKNSLSFADASSIAGDLKIKAKNGDDLLSVAEQVTIGGEPQGRARRRHQLGLPQPQRLDRRRRLRQDQERCRTPSAIPSSPTSAGS